MKEITLTDQEAQLLVESLESQHRELLPEIRHTDTSRLRGELRARLRTIDRLIERLRGIDGEVIQAQRNHHAT
jgi:hypothetical protein